MLKRLRSWLHQKYIWYFKLGRKGRHNMRAMQGKLPETSPCAVSLQYTVPKMSDEWYTPLSKSFPKSKMDD